jgi:CubicO group peptidase (beta-lactamase class C family)
MTDSYIASLKLRTDPGAAQAYSDCGYYFLGRILREVRGKGTLIDVLQKFLFTPLNISRFRLASSLIVATPEDEARYRSHTIGVNRSVMSNDRHLVPVDYGTTQFAKLGGAAGLSAATTDVARLIAILLSKDDNAAMRRTTIQQMLDAAVANQIKAKHTRAGHGWDSARANKAGTIYYAQKGGSTATSGNVLQFNGQLGFAMCWGGKATGAPHWYPNFSAVMKIAGKASWASDLFPEYGMM